MAIYHLNVKTVSRGSGGSAGSSYDYLNRDGKYTIDKDEVLAADNGNMPDWANNQPGEYWQAADVYERANARLCKRVEFALPRELDAEAQKKLVDDFARKLADTKDGPLPYSYAIHKGHDQDNPHCHLIISERVNDGQARNRENWFKRANSAAPAQGGAKKTEALKPKEWLEETRENWQNQANRALERAGHDSRIDHRSLDAQGVARAPGRHRGVALNAMLHKDKLKPQEVEKEIQPDNLEAKKQELDVAKALKASFEAGRAGAKNWFRHEKRNLAFEERERKRLEDERLKKEKEEKAAQRQKSRRGQGYSR